MHVIDFSGDRRHRKHTHGVCVRERIERETERERERQRERYRASERERVSVIVVFTFLLNLTGTVALTPLFSAHNLLHKGID